MITEDYVSFEIAKLLKEKGFNEYCFCINYPLPKGGHHNIILPNLLNNSTIPFTDEYKFCRYKEDFITMPTLQMACKWLREVHKLSVRPRYEEVEDERERVYYFWFFDILSMHPYKTLVEIEQGYPTYEEACEAAIKYCLEHLI